MKTEKYYQHLQLCVKAEFESLKNLVLQHGEPIINNGDFDYIYAKPNCADTVIEMEIDEITIENGQLYIKGCSTFSNECYNLNDASEFFPGEVAKLLISINDYMKEDLKNETIKFSQNITYPLPNGVQSALDSSMGYLNSELNVTVDDDFIRVTHKVPD